MLCPSGYCARKSVLCVAKGGGTHERLHESPAPAVLPGAGVPGDPRGAGDAARDAAGEAGPAGPGSAAETGGPGDRTAGGDLPGVLHRRVPAGSGDRRRADALLLRRSSSGSSMPSHVLTAIGLTSEYAEGTLRVTFGDENTKEDVEYLVENLTQIVKELRATP